MRRVSRNDSGLARDTGLNSSDLAAEMEGLRSASKRAGSLTPLASFSSEELSLLRRTMPDAYQAILQYEQICRHDMAVIEAKEAELHRCIGVGQEVLGQLDQLKTRCSQLAGERDGALSKVKALEQQLRRSENAPAFRTVNVKASETIRGDPREMENSLRELLRQREEEIKQTHLRAQELENVLKEERHLHNALKRDLEGAVQAARLAGASSEAAEKARRAAEASLAEMKLRAEEKERELLRSQAALREAEGSLYQQQKESATMSAQYRDSQKPSAEILTASALLVTLYNQLQDIVVSAGRSQSRKQPPSSVVLSQVTRLRLPTAVTLGSSSGTNEISLTTGQLEHWFAQSLEEMGHLIAEFARVFQQVEERLRRCELDQERTTTERQVAVGEAHDLARENEQLRQSLVALREEVQELDAQTDRLREVDSLEARRQANIRLAALEEEKRREQAALQRELEQVRRQGALELAALHEQLENERRQVEQEIRSLRSDLSQWREEERLAAGRHSVMTGSSPSKEDYLPMKEQLLSLQERLEESEAENQRLRTKTSQEMAELRDRNTHLEQLVQDARSRYQRQVQLHEEEMERVVESKRDLQRRHTEDKSALSRRVEELQCETRRVEAAERELKSESLRVFNELERVKTETQNTITLLHERHKTELDQSKQDMEMLAEQTANERSAYLAATNEELRAKLEDFQRIKETELREKDSTISALNRQLCDAGIEAARLQDALHRSSQKAKENAAAETVPVDRYEEIETELMQEREHVQALTNSLNVVQTQVEELRVKFDEQKQSVRDCLRQLPPSPARQFARITSLLQESTKKATMRLLAILDEPRSVSPFSLSSQREDVNVTTPRFSGGDSTPVSRGLQPAGSSPSAHPPMVSPRSLLRRQQQQTLSQPEQRHEPNGSRTLSPPTSPLEDMLSSPSTPGALQHHEVALAFCSALQLFLNDLTSAIEQVALSPYTRCWDALEHLNDFFRFSSADLDTTLEPSSTRDGEKKKIITSGGDGGNEGENKNDNNVNASTEENTNDDAIWIAVVSGILDAYVDACVAVFRRLYRNTTGYLREREENFQRSSNRLSNDCGARLRRITSDVAEREQELSMRLKTAQSKLHSTQRLYEESNLKVEDITSRYNDVCARVEHLEEQLFSKRREWETEREQWRDALNKLQMDHDARQQGGGERQELLLRQTEELRLELQNTQSKLHGSREEEQRIRREADATRAETQEEIQRLERELSEALASQTKASQALQDIRAQLATSNLALQERQNYDMSRAKRAERSMETLQQEVRESHALLQSLQRSLQMEKVRTAAAEEHSKNLCQELEEQSLEVQRLKERIEELQESLGLQQKALDAEIQESDALRKVNHILEERLAGVEGEREPLRQQLHSILLLKPH